MHLSAEDPTLLSAPVAELAVHLGGLQADGADPVHLVHAVLGTHPGRGLLIFDNVPNADALHGFLPPTGSGHVLITSRSGSWPEPHSLELPVLDLEPATAFLLERSARQETQALGAVAAELAGPPLALEQAGTYMAETGTGPSDYLDLLARQRTALLAEGKPWGYAERVTSTWQAAFEQLAGAVPQAIALLRLLACYAPDDIPYQLLLDDLAIDPLVELGIGKSAKKQLSLLPVGRLQVNTAAAALRRYCLISRPRDGLVSIHRLVQAVTLDQLTPSQRAAWSAAAANILLALPASRRSPGAEAGLLPQEHKKICSRHSRHARCGRIEFLTSQGTDPRGQRSTSTTTGLPGRAWTAVQQYRTRKRAEGRTAAARWLRKRAGAVDALPLTESRHQRSGCRGTDNWKGVLNAIRIARRRPHVAARVPQLHEQDGGLRSRLRDPRTPASGGWRGISEPPLQHAGRAGRWC
ncbi:hypothetical protein ACIA8R_08815 [Nonomuraea sp. NPDC051191]|uniref:DUF7779 domain-containing protein n=1 Tax=Nonomuraea sp. NPDC051191 TaxID=3364372 RepID=UPI0037AD213E